MFFQKGHPIFPVLATVGPENDVFHVLMLQLETEFCRSVVDVTGQTRDSPTDWVTRMTSYDVIKFSVLIGFSKTFCKNFHSFTTIVFCSSRHNEKKIILKICLKNGIRSFLLLLFPSLLTEKVIPPTVMLAFSLHRVEAVRLID